MISIEREDHHQAVDAAGGGEREAVGLRRVHHGGCARMPSERVSCVAHDLEPVVTGLAKGPRLVIAGHPAAREARAIAIAQVLGDRAGARRRRDRNQQRERDSGVHPSSMTRRGWSFHALSSTRAPRTSHHRARRSSRCSAPGDRGRYRARPARGPRAARTPGPWKRPT